MQDSKKARENIVFNVVYAFVAQGISMVFSVLMSLFVPKILDVNAYCYWQLFLFYSSYAGLFQLGMNDGIYLKYGGVSRKNIDTTWYTLQLVFEIGYLLIFQMLLLVNSIFLSDENRRFVIAYTGIYIVIYNISLYIGYMFQATNETRIFSKAVMIDRISYILFLSIAVIINKVSFSFCIFLYVLTRMIMLIYLLIKGRGMLSISFVPMREMVEKSWMIMKIGLPLMLANIVSQLILGNARFFIDYNWGIEAFGKCSFAITITNCCLQFVAQVSMVLFPVLRQMELRKRNDIYVLLRKGLGIILPIIYVAYIPLNFFLEWWLPQYKDSLVYLAILLPICIFDSRMNLLCGTFFKTNRYESVLFKINLLVLVLSVLLNLGNALIICNLEWLLFGISGVIIFRNIISQYYYEKKNNIVKDNMMLGNVGLAIMFIYAYNTFNRIITLIVLLIALSLFYLKNYRELFFFLELIQSKMKAKMKNKM